MDIHQSLAGDQSEPDEDRPRRINQEVVNSLGCGKPGFLKNVVGIYAAVKSRIHAERDQSPQSIAMLGKQFRHRVLVTLGDSTDQFRIGRIIHHGQIPQGACRHDGMLILYQTRVEG